MLKCVTLGVLAVMLNPSAAGATETMSGMSASSEERVVIALEDQWTRAEITRDEATLGRGMDDQFILNSNGGQTSGKGALIEGVLGWNMTGQTISERSVLVTGDTAVIFGTTELRFAVPGEADTSSLLRYTSAYVKRDGQWRALALQMAGRETE